ESVRVAMAESIDPLLVEYVQATLHSFSSTSSSVSSPTSFFSHQDPNEPWVLMRKKGRGRGNRRRCFLEMLHPQTQEGEGGAQTALDLLHHYNPLKLDHIHLDQIQSTLLHQLSQCALLITSIHMKQQCFALVHEFSLHPASNLRVQAVAAMVCCQGLETDFIERELV
ncbi:hypothetical protein HMI55_003565, partial [Coelomomyces lativittatus]